VGDGAEAEDADVDLLGLIAAAEAVVVVRVEDSVELAPEAAVPDGDQTDVPLVLCRVETVLSGASPGETFVLWTRPAYLANGVPQAVIDCRYLLFLRARPLAPDLLSGTRGDGRRVFERLPGEGAVLLEMPPEVRARMAVVFGEEAFAEVFESERPPLDRRLRRATGVDPLGSAEPFLAAVREACAFLAEPARREALREASRASDSVWRRWLATRYDAWNQRGR